MRIKPKQHGDTLEGDLTPMIDMTFQLIAFFMVLVNFTEAEQDDRVKLPESELAKPPESPLEDYITVQLTRDAKCIIEGNLVGLDGVRQLLIRHGQVLEARGKLIGDTTVIVRAHQEVATGKVQKLIEECQGANFEKFVLRAKEKAAF